MCMLLNDTNGLQKRNSKVIGRAFPVLFIVYPKPTWNEKGFGYIKQG